MKKLLMTLLVVWHAADATHTFKQHTICVIGTGYVGLVFGTGLAELGHQVACVDIDQQKISNLKQGIIPIYEPGLSQLLLDNHTHGRLTFSTDIDQAIQDSSIIFIAVGTPGKPDGSADSSAVEAVVKRIGANLNGYKVICTKSTVPIGMNRVIRDILQPAQEGIDFDIVSNPEFLREGTAVHDFFNPDRIVIGAHNAQACAIMKQVYGPLIDAHVPVLETDTTTAETIKYASNAFLAVKLSYINEIDLLCKAVGAQSADVSRGMGLDPRIGPYFLKPGPGFGGSCLPKDSNALVRTAQEHNVQLRTVQAALETNEAKKRYVVETVISHMGDQPQGKTVAVWGLAFKANTDDVREAPAISIIKQLRAYGVQIKAYDPIANAAMKTILPDITYCASKEEAVVDADLLLVLTEWPEFSQAQAGCFACMKQKMLVDTRNIITHQI